MKVLIPTISAICFKGSNYIARDMGPIISFKDDNYDTEKRYSLWLEKCEIERKNKIKPHSSPKMRDE